MEWSFKAQSETKKVIKLSKDLNINLAIAKILYLRNIKTYDEAKKFFRPNLNDLHDPFLMKDMEVAVERVEYAIANNENILIYGDYDVDGTSAVSLMASYLKTIYKNVATYIPSRYSEGYGISYEGIDFAYDNNISLIIALDCGIKAIEKVAYAKEKNIDFIICDHHKPSTEIPKAYAVLNPKRNDCNYPFDELCGCGIGFKLIQALGCKRNQTIEDFLPYLDLVVIAIAADIVPINGENRTLAYFGLQVLNKNPRNGIKAVMHRINNKVTISDVVFIISPRINAAGRIKHANLTVELLTETSFDAAKILAKKIEELNTQRKVFEKKITEEAILQIIKNKEESKFTTVVFQEDWHKGVIGIVASKLTEKHYRPTVIFAKNGDKIVASARSVNNFDIYEALKKCDEYIEQFGGHKYAAGLTVLPKNYEKFKNKFEKVVSESIDKKSLINNIYIDLKIELSELTPKFFNIIKQMSPFGPTNKNPVFMTTGVRDKGYGKLVGEDKTHLKINVFQEDKNNSFDAIGFNLGKKIKHIDKEFSIVYTLEENNWNGCRSIQLVLKDLK